MYEDDDYENWGKRKLDFERYLETRPTIKEWLERISNRRLADAKSGLEFEMDDVPDDEEIFRAESRVISELYNELGDFRRYLENNYKKQLWKKDKWYPRKWMVADPAISRLLERYRFSDVLNALEEKRYNHRLKGDKYVYLFSPEGYQYGSKYKLAAFRTDADFYNAILPGLGVAQITLQK